VYGQSGTSVVVRSRVLAPDWRPAASSVGLGQHDADLLDGHLETQVPFGHGLAGLPLER
jgi:hypothetical protein